MFVLIKLVFFLFLLKRFIEFNFILKEVEFYFYLQDVIFVYFVEKIWIFISLFSRNIVIQFLFIKVIFYKIKERYVQIYLEKGISTQFY